MVLEEGVVVHSCSTDSEPCAFKSLGALIFDPLLVNGMLIPSSKEDPKNNEYAGGSLNKYNSCIKELLVVHLSKLQINIFSEAINLFSNYINNSKEELKDYNFS